MHLNLPGKLLFERLECEKVVSEDESVVEEVVLREPSPLRDTTSTCPRVRREARPGVDSPCQPTSVRGDWPSDDLPPNREESLGGDRLLELSLQAVEEGF